LHNFCRITFSQICKISYAYLKKRKQKVISNYQARLEAEILEATTQELLLQEYPSDCCPESYYLRFPCLVGDPDSPFWQGWGNLRIKTFRLIENKYFETAVIAMILISSLALVSGPFHMTINVHVQNQTKISIDFRIGSASF
jgi:hypothetical protein